jgi:hypothetical protein
MLLRSAIVALLALCPLHLSAEPATNALPTLDEVLASKQDLWGLAAIRQTNGPNYDFFARLLPPLRYVNAEFRHYPIVLSAPGAMQKARLVSNGSAINARANLKTWKDQGLPVSFRVGDDQEMFGQDLSKLRWLTTNEGYGTLAPPSVVAGMTYEHRGVVYREDAFASVWPRFAEHGVVLVGFTADGNKNGVVSARIESPEPLVEKDGTLRDTNGNVLVRFSEYWKAGPGGTNLTAKLTQGKQAVLEVATAVGGAQDLPTSAATALGYDQQLSASVTRWHDLLAEGAQFDTPEPIVNDAWRSLVLGCFTLLKSNAMNYSAGNQYERLYQAECGDAARSLLLWGHPRESLAMLTRLFDYTRDGLEFHNAGFKLQAFAHWYWLTRDADAVRALRPKWQPEIDRIVNGREKESGLFPKERYCGDIATRVHSLNPNASCWRGLRDFAAVLADLGEDAPAKHYTEIATEFRNAISNAVAQSEDRSTSPPFVPMMLFGEEKPYDQLTSTKLGSYWNLLAPYVIGSGVFGPGSERGRWMVDYLQEHGGICMGMIRFHQHSGLFANEDALDDLYGLRYTLKLLELDEVDRALVSFYGKLAQGMTRGTFIGAEGTGLRPLDDRGRPMYLPPNSAANALFLWTLRYLLVQDLDLNDDGKPDTLRLAFATPKAWLEDGKSIAVREAPTAFGPVSFSLQSKLSAGEVQAILNLPERNSANRTLLRVRVPDGWRVISARVGSETKKADERGTVDISSIKGGGGVTGVTFKVVKD